MQLCRLTVLLIAAAAVAVAQPPAPNSLERQPTVAAQQVWQMQDSGTAAGLRGIDSVDGKIAWASGTEGTVLKTTDGGAHWQKCAVPDADKDGTALDFRGIQSWDAQTAIVMASGPGDKSRLYRTTDGCKTWVLLLTNPDKEGFWDAIYFERTRLNGPHRVDGWLLGDPVDGAFTLYHTSDGKTWVRQKNGGLRADLATQGAFAASNSSLVTMGGFDVLFAGGGKGGAFSYAGRQEEVCASGCPLEEAQALLNGNRHIWVKSPIPVGGESEASGVFAVDMRAGSFSIAARPADPTVFSLDARPAQQAVAAVPAKAPAYVAVGGDYTKPAEGDRAAAWSSDGEHWTASATPPHGYRSTVQWSEPLKLWITAGTNGSDISRDDGRTWQPLDDGNWNALSLPFIVGPKGRIGRLNPAALPPAK